MYARVYERLRLYSVKKNIPHRKNNRNIIFSRVMVGVKLHIHGTIASDGGPKKIKGANSSMKEILSMQITKMHTNSFMWNVLKFFEYHTIVRSFLYLFTEGVLKISLYSVFPVFYFLLPIHPFLLQESFQLSRLSFF